MKMNYLTVLFFQSDHLLQTFINISLINCEISSLLFQKFKERNNVEKTGENVNILTSIMLKFSFAYFIPTTLTKKCQLSY